jgi:hypothetical protein
MCAESVCEHRGRDPGGVEASQTGLSIFLVRSLTAAVKLVEAPGGAIERPAPVGHVAM